MPNTEWSPYEPALGGFDLIDGTRSEPGEPVMCRKVDGKWEYRRMTEDEAREFEYCRAW